MGCGSSSNVKQRELPPRKRGVQYELDSLKSLKENIIAVKNEQYFPADPVIVDPTVISQNKELALKFFKAGIMVGVTFRAKDKELTEEQAEVLGFCLENMPQIQRMTLDFTETKLPPQPFKILLQQLTKAAKPLQDYYIRLRGSTIADEQLISLLETSQQIISSDLWKFAFDISETNISDNVFSSLNNFLKKTQKMEGLEFVFSRCPNITDAGISLLKEPLQQMNEMSQLKFVFHGRPTPDLLDQFSHYKELDEKDHSTEVSADITDNGLKMILEGMTNMKNLRKLIMTLRGCKKITDRGLETFKAVLPRLERLQLVRIDVSKLPLITDSGLKSLSEGLSSLKCSGIAIISDENSQITDKGVISIIETLKGNSYHSLRFSFLGCSAITSHGVKVLLESLKNDFYGLKALYLGFSDAPGIKNDAVGYFVNIIEGIKTLTLYEPTIRNVGFPTGPLTAYSEGLIKEMKKLGIPDRDKL